MKNDQLHRTPTAVTALLAATIAPARFLDPDDDAVGLQPGAEADVVLLRANPLDDIANVRAIARVILRGRSVPIPGGSP